MRTLLFAAAALMMLAGSDAFAQGRYSSSSTYRGSSSYYGPYSSSRTYSSSSTTPFLYRGYNPGHIIGNSVRRMYWGPSMGPRR